jgi:class 3 adenylate cyclase/tetratricopeptide (TPR) repeat protein
MCGAENSEHAGFCQACGEPLEAGSTWPRETRKTVTVLFMDVVDSTQLGERLDPESTRRVMSRLFEVVRPALERHGGTVEKYIGDAVMAVFGVPTVHEDDALRACRAALEIQDEVARLNQELERDWGMSITTRTGVNTGLVIAGDPSSGQTFVTGDAVNTAARLEQSAPSSAVLIGEPTYRLVMDAVDAESVEPVEAKGKGEAVAAYRLLSVVLGVPVRARRLDSPMVGRERELGVLTNAFERSVAELQCVLATVIGMPGVGKSRLVYEFVTSAAGRATVLQGRCLPYGEGITFWPVANVVHEAAGITESDSPEEARSKIEALLPGGDDRVVLRDRVAAAVGLGEATWSIQETFWAVRKLLEAVARERPLIVVFDDIHWAEQAFLDLVEYLEGWSRGWAVLIVCISRPELLARRADWGIGATEPATVTLEPLGREESDRLIANLLAESPVRADFRGRVAEAAEGNPLFVEEMLQMLIDEKRLQRQEDRWVVADDSLAVPTPPSIQGLLTARIEQLPEAEREILQRASVVGKVFWWGAVADLSPEAARADVSSKLQTLVRKGMIRPDESAFAGQDAFRFKHILIRDAAYESVPREMRAGLHERLAGWLEQAAGDRVDEYEEIIGYHLEQACHQRLAPGTAGARNLAVRASKVLASAGRRAFERGDINAALSLLPRAWELNPVDEPGSLDTLRLFARATRRRGNLKHADEVLADLERRALRIGDRSIEWLAKIERLETVSSMTKLTLDEAKPTIDQAIGIFEERGDDLGLSRCWDFLGHMHFNAGRCAEAMRADARAAHHAAAAGDISMVMDETTQLAGRAVFGPMPVSDALALCDETLQRVKGHPANEAWVHQGRSLLEAMRGDFEASRASIAHAVSVAKELGFTHMVATMSSTAADIERYAGDRVAEEREWRSGYEAFARSGADSYRSTWAAWLALSLIGLERDQEEAFRLTIESETLAGEDDITAQIPWREGRALVLARKGHLEQAERLARKAIDIAERTDWLNIQGDVHLTLAKVLQLGGRPDEAADAARGAAERYERKGNIVATGWARAQLDELAPPHD